MYDHLLKSKKIEGYGLLENHASIDCWKIRDFFSIGAYSHIGAGTNAKNFTLGRFSRIDENVHIGIDHEHPDNFSNHFFAFAVGSDKFPGDKYKKIKSNRYFYDRSRTTFIGNDVWIQKNSIITEGVNIGNGAIIYPNSYVNQDVPPYSIFGGVPARLIGFRFPARIIDRIEQSQWTRYDLSEVTEEINWGDINAALALIESNRLQNACHRRFFINSQLDFCEEDHSRKVIIGPSHVERWRESIGKAEIDQPNFFLYGRSGLSLYSKEIDKIIDYFISIGKDEITLMVPDFRIGNAGLFDGRQSQDGRLIYKPYITKDNDAYTSKLSTQILDHLHLKYSGKLNFLFWCLYAREQLNKSSGKHISPQGYHHPFWNYEALKLRYGDACLDLSGLDGEIKHLIDKFGSVHPVSLGYKILEGAILHKAAVNTKRKISPTILIRTHRWDSMNEAIAQYYSKNEVDVIFIVDEVNNEHISIPSPWKKVSITKEWIINNNLRFQDDVMWRCGDYCYYAAFQAFPQLNAAWLLEDEALVVSKDIKNFLSSFEKWGIDFLGGKFGKRSSNNYLYKAISFKTKHPWGCLFSATYMTSKLANDLFHQRTLLKEYFSNNQSTLKDENWTNDEYFVMNFIDKAHFTLAPFEFIHRWSTSQTLHFSTQNVLMAFDSIDEFPFADRFYHPTLITGLNDPSIIARKTKLLTKHNNSQ